jgi:hypothetical protein
VVVAVENVEKEVAVVVEAKQAVVLVAVVREEVEKEVKNAKEAPSPRVHRGRSP